MVSDRVLPGTALGESLPYMEPHTSGVDPLVVVVVRTGPRCEFRAGHCLLFSAEIGVVYGWIWVVKTLGYWRPTCPCSDLRPPCRTVGCARRSASRLEVSSEPLSGLRSRPSPRSRFSNSN